MQHPAIRCSDFRTNLDSAGATWIWARFHGVDRCPEPDAWFAIDAGDHALVAHLDRCAECRAVAAVIAKSKLVGEDLPDGAALGLVPELLPSGARLGRYIVRGAIGAGGMGVVLEAHDPKLDRRVALKIVRRLRDDASWARAKARVLAEAQAMARLAHPNVIAIHDLVEIGDEQLIAMEHVDGPDLEAWLATSPPFEERVRVIVDAARGLAAAHAAGVIHRDIKPSNIMIGADGRARVSDFGLAALGDEVAPGAVGTPGFLAPEVARGGAIDARADQYAFAVTAWRALFEAPPGENGHGDHARVLTRALSTDPAERWPSMQALVDALERRPRRRWPWLAAAIALVLVGGGVWWLRRADEPATCVVDEAPLWPPGARTAWIARMREVAGPAAETLAGELDRSFGLWREASEAACGRPVGVTECLASHRRKLASYIAHAHESAQVTTAQSALAAITSPKLCLQAPELRPMASTPELEASRAPFKIALDEIGTLQALGRYDQALVKLDALVAIAPPSDAALRGALLYNKADTMARAGDVAGSVPVLEESLQIAERAGNDVARLNTMILLLSAYEELGKSVEAAALAKVAEAAVQRVPRDPDVHARLASILGSLAYNAGDHVAAERHYREVVRSTQELHGERDAQLAGALHNLGLAVHMAGRVDEAVELQQRSLAMFEATVGATHPDTALPVTELAGLALERSDRTEAIALFRRGLAIREAALGPNHPHLSETLIGLARTLAEDGKPDEAQAGLRRAIELGAALGEHHPLGAVARYQLADLLDRRKAPAAEIVPLLEHAVVSWDDSQVALPEAGWTKFLLAQYRWKAGDRAGARTLATQARTTLGRLSAPYAKHVKEVDAWIAIH